MATRQFNVEEFAHNPTHEQLLDIRKVDWVTLANYYGISYASTLRKEQLKNVVVESLVDQKILPEIALQVLTPVGLNPDKNGQDSVPSDIRTTPTATMLDMDKQFELEKLKLQYTMEMNKEIQLAQIQAEQQRQQLEVDKEIRLAQISSEDKKVEMELQMKKSTEEEEKNRREKEMRRIKPSEAAAQLPAFVEDDVDSYFRTFEKIATQNEWPANKWLSFLVPKLIGKAYKVYSTLEGDSDYDMVKTTILKAYSVTPDSYRQKFRSMRKGFDQTFTEFAQELTRVFKKWLTATETTTFDQLVNLLVMEQFKSRLPFFLLRHIEERGEKNVEEAAGLTDSHDLLVQSLNAGDSHRPVKTSPGVPFKPNKPRTLGQNQTGNSNFGNTIFCTYCKKPGHWIQDCKSPGCKASKQAVVKSQPPVKPIMSINANTKEADLFEPYKRQGTVSLPNVNTKYHVNFLRDTGAAMSMIMQSALPNIESAFTGEKAIAAALGARVSCPIAEVYVESPIYTGSLKVLVTNQTFEVPNVQVLIGNEVKGSQVINIPLVVNQPVEELDPEISEVFPVCAMTRAQARNQPPVAPPDPSDNLYNHVISKSSLIEAQKSDPSLDSLRHAITDDRMTKTPYFYQHEGVLMRLHRPTHLLPTDTWAETHQVVLPASVREKVIKLAHDGPSGHLGIKKTYSKILNNFFWPGMRKQITQYIKSCHVCQVVGKPNQVIPQAPMKPILVPEEPFSKVVIDCVGPLPKTKKGNEYLITIMDPTTRYPEAIPVKNITAKTIVRHLLHFFTTVGLPNEIQSDRGSNFTSHLFEEIIKRT